MPAYVDALRSKAILATRQSQWDVAQQTLDEALALVTIIRYPYGHARVLHDYGILHIARGGVEQAHERLEASLSLLNSLGERLLRRAYQTCAIVTTSLLDKPQAQLRIH